MVDAYGAYGKPRDVTNFTAEQLLNLRYEYTPEITGMFRECSNRKRRQNTITTSFSVRLQTGHRQGNAPKYEGALLGLANLAPGEGLFSKEAEIVQP